MTCREKILSNDYADLIVDFPLYEPEYGEASPMDFCYHMIDDTLAVMYISRDELLSFDITPQTYPFLPKCFGLMESINGKGRIIASQTGSLNTLSLIESGILQTQQPPLSLEGKNVTIAFIDTGIRYDDYAFRDIFGRSRIRAIWDQTIQEGEPPDGFLYGTEYTREQIDEAIASVNPLSVVPSYDTNGHGSVMAAVAAGSMISDERGSFTGAAPQSEIVVVKLKEIKPYLREFYMVAEDVPCYSESDVLQALQYVRGFAASLSEPLVICLGIGSGIGEHAGLGLLSRYIDSVCRQKSVAVVIAGGNEGNAAHHFRGEIPPGQDYVDVELRVGENERGFVMDLWGQAPYFFGVVLRSPGGEVISWENPRLSRPQEYRFVFERTVVILDSLIVEQTSGAELIRFRFLTPAPGIWTLRVNAAGNRRQTSDGQNIGSSIFNIWLPITGFLSGDTYFLSPSPDTTITEPGYAHDSITVAAHQLQEGGIYPQSGRGYASDGYRKPDLSAVGANVSTPYGSRSGSSLAAAITAGGCAQLMEWAVVRGNDRLVNSIDIRSYLIRGAAREDFMNYPNRINGADDIIVSS